MSLLFNSALFRECIKPNSGVELRTVVSYYFYDRSLSGIWELPNGQRVFYFAVDDHMDLVVPVSQRRARALHNNGITLREAIVHSEAGWYVLASQPHKPLQLGPVNRQPPPRAMLPRKGYRVRHFDFATWKREKRRP